MGFYDDMQAIATDILTEFNQGVMKYVKLVPGNGPVDDPGAATRQEFDIIGTAGGVSFKYVSQSLAVASDKQIIAAVDARYVPSISDMVSIDGLDYKIVHVEPKPAAGTVAAYLMIVRRGQG